MTKNLPHAYRAQGFHDATANAVIHVHNIIHGKEIH